MSQRKLQISQLESKINGFQSLREVSIPPKGWLNAVRTSLGMTLQQLATRLSISKQSVQEIEKREEEKSLTIKTLREAARALDMELVYGLVPRDGTLDALIDRKAEELAKRIVARTSNTMKLEDQENSKERLIKAIEERKAIIKHELPKMLWD